MEKAKTQQRYEHNLLNEYLLHRNTTEKVKYRSIRIALIKKRECRELFLWNSTLIYQFNTTKGTQEVSLESRTTGNTTSNEDFTDSNGIQPRQNQHTY